MEITGQGGLWEQPPVVQGEALELRVELDAVDAVGAHPGELRPVILVPRVEGPAGEEAGPAHMLRVAGTFPRLRCICAHLGNWGDSWFLPLLQNLDGAVCGTVQLQNRGL